MAWSSRRGPAIPSSVESAWRRRFLMHADAGVHWRCRRFRCWQVPGARCGTAHGCRRYPQTTAFERDSRCSRIDLCKGVPDRAFRPARARGTSVNRFKRGRRRSAAIINIASGRCMDRRCGFRRHGRIALIARRCGAALCCPGKQGDGCFGSVPAHVLRARIEAVARQNQNDAKRARAAGRTACSTFWIPSKSGRCAMAGVVLREPVRSRSYF